MPLVRCGASEMVGAVAVGTSEREVDISNKVLAKRPKGSLDCPRQLEIGKLGAERWQRCLRRKTRSGDMAGGMHLQLACVSLGKPVGLVKSLAAVRR